jgi:preprotein translocase subunit YajC
VDFVTIVPLLLIGVVFYLLVLRPQKARQKAQAAMIAAVAPGSSIMTTAGVFGTVVASSADEVSIEIAPGVVIRMLPAAIAKVIPVEAPASDSAAVDLDKPSSDESAQ